ncbi:MAG TPA: hypothetical protein VKC66_07645, partial [Xanthobacteraceae bacterium]|nr:hypothetical protein [Xanthobacteraceae bacterium]
SQIGIVFPSEITLVLRRKAAQLPGNWSALSPRVQHRSFWATLSDYIGRKNTYYTFFLLGIAMYLADVFGTQFVGAIHGRLLTAWSTAGIVGPVVVNYIREFEIAAGVPRDHVYDVTMYVLAAMLVAGFVCNYRNRGKFPGKLLCVMRGRVGSIWEVVGFWVRVWRGEPPGSRRTTS